MEPKEQVATEGGEDEPAHCFAGCASKKFFI